MYDILINKAATKAATIERCVARALEEYQHDPQIALPLILPVKMQHPECATRL